MAIKINGKDVTKRIINGKEVVKVILNEKQIWPESTPPAEMDYLCFTITDSHIVSWGVKIYKKYSRAETIQLEMSYNKVDWEDYTLGTTVSILQYFPLYFRSKSGTPISTAGYRIEAATTSTSLTTSFINVSGDPASLVCNQPISSLDGLGACFGSMFYNQKYFDFNGLKLPYTTLSTNCFNSMFYGCERMTHAPDLPALALPSGCYQNMFYRCKALVVAPSIHATSFLGGMSCASMFAGCQNLEYLPELHSTTMESYCYNLMFNGCSKIKLSETQTGEYQTPYRIPSSGTGIPDPDETWNYSMLSDTGGTFTGYPELNRTYYTSNQIV